MNTEKWILIVEDEVLIAMDLEDELTDRGFNPVTASTLPVARQQLQDTKWHFAILDMHLKSDTTFGLAVELRDRGIPFVFLSGNDATSLPEHLRGARVLTKPVLLDDLIAAIEDGEPPA